MCETFRCFWDFLGIFAQCLFSRIKEEFAEPRYIIALHLQYVEDFLFTFGMDGKGCLLRAICEMHESPLLGYGLVGELINIFLT